MRSRVFTQPGSFPDLGGRNRDVRFTPMSGRRQLVRLRPKSANVRERLRAQRHAASHGD
jgi:hypothetical protein